MRNWLILLLAAALPWGLVAQASPQQQLPNAPSTSKYPPPAPAPATPPPSATQQTSPPAEVPQSGSTPAPAGSMQNNAGSPAATGTAAAASDIPDDTVTVIR